jgi:hypothetical protein
MPVVRHRNRIVICTESNIYLMRIINLIYKSNENFSFVFSPGDGTYYAIYVKRNEGRAYSVR